MADGMAPEGLPQEIEEAIDGVMERVEDLSRVLEVRGYDSGTAPFDIARDELVEAITAEHPEGENARETLC
ncbi:MAG: hypothetical protein ACFB50_15655 [Rubrobacteraceae bacterium]